MREAVFAYLVAITAMFSMLTCTRAATAAPTFTLPEDTIIFRSDFSSVSAASFISQLMRHKGRTVTIWLDSPGGSVFALDQMISAVKASGKRTVCITGFSASASFMFLQAACDVRLVQPNSVLMSHQAATAYRGEVNRIESFKKLIDGMLLRLDKMVSSRIGLSVEELRAKSADEWWVQGDAAVDNKLADKVAYFKCSSKMINSTYEEIVQVFIFTFNLTWSKCPIITHPVQVNGEPQFYQGESLDASTRFMQHKDYYLKDAFAP